MLPKFLPRVMPLIVVVALALAVASPAQHALAQADPAAAYPSRAVKVIVSAPPGGGLDIAARVVADRLAKLWGQPFVVENRPGAGGNLGTEAVAQAEPDGYTLLAAQPAPLTTNVVMYKKLNFDPAAFEPLAIMTSIPNTLVVRTDFPANSVQELIAYAKANPGKVSFGSAGVGTMSHVAGEYFATSAGIKLVHVPYRGTGPALADLIGGHIPMALAPIPAAHGPVAQGQLRGLAVTSIKRSSLVPDLPTVAESGIPDFEASLYYGIVAPAGTPRPIVERLNQALRDALATDDVKRRLTTDGAEPTPGSPEDYAAHIDRDEKRWSVVVKASGAKAE